MPTMIHKGRSRNDDYHLHESENVHGDEDNGNGDDGDVVMMTTPTTINTADDVNNCNNERRDGKSKSASDLTKVSGLQEKDI